MDTTTLSLVGNAADHLSDKALLSYWDKENGYHRSGLPGEILAFAKTTNPEIRQYIANGILAARKEPKTTADGTEYVSAQECGMSMLRFWSRRLSNKIHYIQGLRANPSRAMFDAATRQDIVHFLEKIGESLVKAGFDDLLLLPEGSVLIQEVA